MIFTDEMVSVSLTAGDALEIVDAIAFIIETDPHLSAMLNESGAFSRLAVILDEAIS